MDSENNFPMAEKPKRTKAEAQAELLERFGFKDTAGFQSSLRRGDFEVAESWLQYIVDNKDNFPQYHNTWDSWLADRQQGILAYKQLQAQGQLENIPQRSKVEAQAELLENFGFMDTKGYRMMLRSREVELAEKWLTYIKDNKLNFPQYLDTWDNWLADRERELAEAKK